MHTGHIVIHTSDQVRILKIDKKQITHYIADDALAWYLQTLHTWQVVIHTNNQKRVLNIKKKIPKQYLTDKPKLTIHYISSTTSGLIQRENRPRMLIREPLELVMQKIRRLKWLTFDNRRRSWLHVLNITSFPRANNSCCQLPRIKFKVHFMKRYNS